MTAATIVISIGGIVGFFGLVIYLINKPEEDTEDQS